MAVFSSSVVLVLLFSGAVSQIWDQHFRQEVHSYVQAKITSTLQWLASRRDSNIFDYIAEANRVLGLNLFEGDIKKDGQKARTAVTNSAKLWNPRIVPYVIDSSINDEGRKTIGSAIADFHATTCIRWQPRSIEPDYVVFKNSTGCYSNVGRIGGKQTISLMPACFLKGSAIHEMMHTVGFWHEQSRPDRDPWVKIVYGNVQSGKVGDFDKLEPSEVNTLGVPYDYGSVLHYSKYAFSRNNNPTILPLRNPEAFLGQREGFSNNDIVRINRLYRCDISYPLKEKTVSAPIQTEPVPVHTTSLGNPTTGNPPTTKDQTPSPNTPQHVVTSAPASVTSQKPIFMTSPEPTPQGHLGWTRWSVWSPCDVNCQSYRHRFCLNYDPTYCSGPDREDQTCPFPCKVSYSLGCWKNDLNSSTIPSMEGVFLDLRDDYHNRDQAFRKCADSAAVLGHGVFALTDGGKCLSGNDPDTSFTRFGTSADCPNGVGGPASISVYSFNTNIDGGWSQWTPWGQCTRTCGGGVQFRYRYCDSPPPVGSGKPCQGLDFEQEECSLDLCEGETKCGIKYHTGVEGTSGYIAVSDYENFMTCEYIITTAKSGVTISLDIKVMDVEYSTSCIYDALMVYDGTDDKAPLLGVYCGSGHPSTFESSSNQLFLRFQSDATFTGKGFTIAYTVNSQSRKSCVEPSPVAHGVVLLGGTMVGQSATFQCDSTFHLIGQARITCLDQPGQAAWSDAFPVCITSHKRSVTQQYHHEFCSFEENICGFTNDSSSFKWSVRRSVRTHATGVQNNGYLFVESNLAWRSDDVARSLSPNYVSSRAGYCLRFIYYTNSLPETLRVFKRHDNQKDVKPVWMAPASKVEGWQEAEVELKTTEGFQLVFEAALGERLGGWAAVDNIQMSHRRCHG